VLSNLKTSFKRQDFMPFRFEKYADRYLGAFATQLQSAVSIWRQ